MGQGDVEQGSKGVGKRSCKDRCRCPTTKKGKAACCCCCCFCFFSTFLFLLALLAGQVGKLGGDAITSLPEDTRWDCTDDLNPTNVIRTTWLPGCGIENKTDAQLDACGGECFSSALVKRMEEFYTKVGYKMVNFSSRAGPKDQDVVPIKAWWIPPAPGMNIGLGPAPRVVVQHGTNQNQNKFEAQIAGFLLASAGFGVLLPSLRDHGYSGPSSHGKFSWGWDYQYDLLAAWDYAKADPQGELGGALPSDQVGLMGYSMGGFTALNAFGIEGAVPGVWVDGAVFSVRQILLNELRKQVSSLGDLSLNFAWRKANQNIELHFQNPAEVLPKGPDLARKVYLVQNTDDTTVPLDQYEQLKGLFEEHPKKYTLSGSWVAGGNCNGDTHRIFALKYPAEYRERTCNFFTSVFGASKDRCTSAMLFPVA